MAEYRVPEGFYERLETEPEELKRETRKQVIKWIREELVPKLEIGDVVWVPDPATGKPTRCVYGQGLI